MTTILRHVDRDLVYYEATVDGNTIIDYTMRGLVEQLYLTYKVDLRHLLFNPICLN